MLSTYIQCTLSHLKNDCKGKAVVLVLDYSKI